MTSIVLTLTLCFDQKINKEMKECTLKIQRYERELDKLNRMKNKDASTISQLQG